MTPTMVYQQLFFFFCLFVFFFFFFFFYRKIGCKKLFPSNTAEIRPIYLKMGHIMRKPVLSYVNNNGADQPAHTRYTDSVSRCRCFVINLLIENKRFCDFWETDF